MSSSPHDRGRATFESVPIAVGDHELPVRDRGRSRPHGEEEGRVVNGDELTHSPSSSRVLVGVPIHRCAPPVGLSTEAHFSVDFSSDCLFAFFRGEG